MGPFDLESPNTCKFNDLADSADVVWGNASATARRTQRTPHMRER